MAMSATLAVPSNVIAGRPATCMLTLSNSGASDVTVSSISPIVTPSGGGGSPSFAAPPPRFPVGRSSTVSASGTLSVPFELVFFLPQTAGNPMTSVGGTYLIDAVTQVSDGTQCAVTVPQWVAVSSGAPVSSDGYGGLRFDDGRQLVNISLL